MATVKKMVKRAANGTTTAQTTKKPTVMQKLIKRYPGTDTTSAGDTRYQEFNAYSPKKELDKIAATDSAFNKKFGKGKPSYKTGGKVKKAQAGLSVPPSKPVGPIDPKGAWTKVQEKTIAGKKAAKVPLKKDKQLGASKMKMGGKMSKKK